MTVFQMSDRELSRLRVMIDLADGRLTVEAAATLMDMGRRQVFRLRRAFAVACSDPSSISEARIDERPCDLGAVNVAHVAAARDFIPGRPNLPLHSIDDPDGFI